MRILLFNEFGNRVELDVGGAFVNGADFTVAEKLLDRIVFGEANSAHPFNTLGSGQSCYFCNIRITLVSFKIIKNKKIKIYKKKF